MKLQTFSRPNSAYSISQWQRLSKYSTEYMPAGEELWIYHDTVSPLSYSSAPHGSCHTLKGQKNRLNMVRLAFLLGKLRGVWARCRWTLSSGAVCVYMSVTAGASLPGDVKGEHDSWQEMMSVWSQRFRCDGGVCRCAGSRGMFLFNYPLYFHLVSCSKEFPLKTFCMSPKPQDLYVYVWLRDF